MIDLIIPYYNNREGLHNTLQSILFPNLFYITLIDDHSTEYPDIFPLRVDQVFRVNINGGPGKARQLGLEKTHNPWIMFLDTGDTFICSGSFNAITTAIENNPNANVISFQYYHYDKISNHQDNRLHGRIYRREFLEKYNITFAPEASYFNEDIGFNRMCRIATEVENQPIIEIDIPIIKQEKNLNSLTQQDDKVVLYRDQTRALAFTSIHTIENCRKIGFDPAPEINQIAISLYYWFVYTAAKRPEYIQEAWSGARIFYKKYEKEITSNKLLLGNNYLKRCLQLRDKIKFPINILRFAVDIQKNEIIPDKYLTFS